MHFKNELVYIQEKQQDVEDEEVIEKEEYDHEEIAEEALETKFLDMAIDNPDLIN